VSRRRFSGNAQKQRKKHSLGGGPAGVGSCHGRKEGNKGGHPGRRTGKGGRVATASPLWTRKRGETRRPVEKKGKNRHPGLIEVGRKKRGGTGPFRFARRGKKRAHRQPLDWKREGGGRWASPPSCSQWGLEPRSFPSLPLLAPCTSLPGQRREERSHKRLSLPKKSWARPVLLIKKAPSCEGNSPGAPCFCEKRKKREIAVLSDRRKGEVRG